METDEPWKEDGFTNKDVLGDVFIGRRKLSLKRFVGVNV